MSRRGPDPRGLRLVASQAEVPQLGPGPLFGSSAPLPVGPRPWELPGMAPDEKVLAFLRELPVVSGLKAGERLELVAFQEQFVRGV